MIDSVVYSRFLGFRYQEKWGGLEGTDEGFNLGFRTGTDVSSLLESIIDNLVVKLDMGVNVE